MRTVWQDVRFALRMMARSPWFTGVAAVSLALGIGASTMAFGWVDGVLLHPLEGVERDNEIVSIENVTPSGTTIDCRISISATTRNRPDRFRAWCCSKSGLWRWETTAVRTARGFTWSPAITLTC